MLQTHLSPAANQRPTVHYAAGNGHYDIVDYLMDHVPLPERNAENDEGGEKATSNYPRRSPGTAMSTMAEGTSIGAPPRTHRPVL